jgi:drug/metabolite transporter (DMT)-like permease
LSRASTAVAALAFNAFVWGVSWWPFRALQDHGWHPLVSTAAIYAVCVLVVLALKPQAAVELWRNPTLAWLMVASGTTNAAFNWAVTTGDVVRVVLLFYLMPLWAVLLARWLLGERLTKATALRVGLAVAGAAVVLKLDQATSAGAKFEWVDALAVLGGFTFALNNVLLRRMSDRSASARTLSMFLGGTLVAMAAAWFTATGMPQGVTAHASSTWAVFVALTFAFLLANVALQHGAALLSAQATAVIMLLEVVFAAASAQWLGASDLDARLWVGGALIVAASLLAALAPSSDVKPT